MNFHKNLFKDMLVSIVIIGFVGLVGLIKTQLTDAYVYERIIKDKIPPGNMDMATATATSSAHFNMIPCDVIFDIYKYDICLDVPDYYYKENPSIYTKTKTYFNILDDVNYSKFKQCLFDDYILYINKLDKEYMTSFWLIL